MLRHRSRDQVDHHPLHRCGLWAHGLCRLLRILHWAFCDQAGTALEDTADWPGLRGPSPRAMGYRVEHGYRTTGGSDARCCRMRYSRPPCSRRVRSRPMQPSATERDLRCDHSGGKICSGNGDAPAPVYATPGPTLRRPSAPAAARAGLAADAAPAPARELPPSVAPAGSNGNRLRVGAKFLVIVPGLRLLEHQVPGLMAQSPGGAVAEVTRNPNDPSVLGLTNLSSSAWQAVSGNGARRQIEPGQTIKLAPGAKIDFGSTDGEVG